MKRLVSNLGLSLMSVALICNTSAWANKAEDRWTQWKINKLKWEKKERNLYKNEKIIPLEDRFAQHWSRMDRIEQKHIEVASLLKGVFPAEYSNFKFHIKKDEGYKGVKYPKEFIIEDIEFIERLHHRDLIKKAPMNIKESVLTRYREQEKRLFAIEKRFWKMSRLLHKFFYDENLEIMALQDELIVENVDTESNKMLTENATIIDIYLNYNSRRMNQLEQSLDVMKEWLHFIKTDYGEITKETLLKDETYNMSHGSLPLHFATVDNKWPVYGFKMYGINVRNTRRDILKQAKLLKQELKTFREEAQKEIKNKKKEISEVDFAEEYERIMKNMLKELEKIEKERNFSPIPISNK